MIRIVLADDHVVLRSGLRALLERHADFEVVGEANDGREMIKLAREHKLVLVAGATHPFADWRTQEIYPDPRYHQVVKDLQLVARANLIFCDSHVEALKRQKFVAQLNTGLGAQQEAARRWNLDNTPHWP